MRLSLLANMYAIAKAMSLCAPRMSTVALSVQACLIVPNRIPLVIQNLPICHKFFILDQTEKYITGMRLSFANKNALGGAV